MTSCIKTHKSWDLEGIVLLIKTGTVKCSKLFLPWLSNKSIHVPFTHIIFMDFNFGFYDMHEGPGQRMKLYYISSFGLQPAKLNKLLLYYIYNHNKLLYYIYNHNHSHRWLGRGYSAECWGWWYGDDALTCACVDGLLVLFTTCVPLGCQCYITLINERVPHMTSHAYIFSFLFRPFCVAHLHWSMLALVSQW
jgi:hypothetical protein